MAYRLFGAILIIISTSVCGYLYSLHPQKRYKNLTMICACLEIFENEVGFSNDTICTIFKRIANLSHFSYLFQTAAEIDEEMSAAKRWKYAIEHDCEKMCLEKGDTEILKLLSCELGTTGKEGQIKSIRHIKTLLERQAISAEEECTKNIKMYRGLGVAGGIFVAILLF